MTDKPFQPSLRDSFGGIRPADVPAFNGAQLVGALASYLLLRIFTPQRVAA